MVEKLNTARETTQAQGENEWSDFPPFKGDNLEQPSQSKEMKDLEEIHECELDIIARNSDVLGYNLGDEAIVWPERRVQAKKAKEFLDSGGDIAALSKQFGQPAELIQKAIDEELSKDELLDDTLSKLPEGTRFRITPHATESPFSVANAEKTVDENGEIRFRIDDEAIAQVRKIREKAKDSELLVVMNQLHTSEDGKPTSNIPKNPEDYIALCKSFVEQSGYSEGSGKGLVIELGNECNMGHESTTDPIFQSDAFAETVEPETYADFYFETAKALKASFPDIKLSLTGIAFYDYDFVKKVVDQIQAKKDADESLKETQLIDVISFHPYRKTVESPTPFKSNGKELDETEIRKRAKESWDSLSDDERNATRQSMLANLSEAERATAAGMSDEEIENTLAYMLYNSFDSQLDSLRKLAEPIGADVTVGEVSFYAGEWGESVDEVEQERNAVHGREKGYTSLLWPGERIVKH